MPVLLMARGDEDARDLLRKAIEARYGVRPPAIESMRIDFDGRIHTKVGPLKTWVPLEITAQFQLPDKMRWDFEVKPMGMTVRRGIESYDGERLRTQRADDTPTVITSEDVIDAAQKRLWAIAALLLTPLGDHFVELELVNAFAFTATNTQIGAVVEVHLEKNYQVDRVSVEALNDETGKVQQYNIAVGAELVSFDNLLLPKQVRVAWDDVPAYEMHPTSAESNPEIPSSVFTLGQNGAIS